MSVSTSTLKYRKRKSKEGESMEESPETSVQKDLVNPRLDVDGRKKHSSGTRRIRRRSDDSDAEYSDHFRIMNERAVEDINLDVFYKPHTLTLLICVILFALYTAFTSDDTHREDNIWKGLKAMFFLFLVISVLTFPNGPFTRPHPALWRMVFGISVLYLMVLMFGLFQNFRDIKAALEWIDPERLNKPKLDDKEYAVNCSQVTLERVWSHLDYFAFGHFMGWAMKAMLIRHTALCWYISVTWEITEILFSHLLPNFQECWWDAIILDIVLCNGLGIWFGMFVCQKLEMRVFHWESVKCIPGAKGKLKRAVLQFTPASWTRVRWLDPECGFMRFIAVSIFVLVWQTTELNTFFLKHVLAVDTTHPLVLYRILLIGAVSAPTIRQYYVYVTDPKCKRMGTQCWVYCAITVSEAILCIKCGMELFAQTQLWSIGIWICILVFGCVFCVYISIVFARRPDVSQEIQVNGETQHRYLDSSHENLTSLPDNLRHGSRLPPSESD